MAASGEVSHLLLEGFPLTQHPKENIRGFFQQFGIQIRDVRQSSILTTSDTPAWILTLNTERDVSAVLGQNLNYNGLPLCLRECDENDLSSVAGAEGGEYPSMISVTGNFETYHDESVQASSHGSHFTSFNPTPDTYFNPGQQYSMGRNPQMPYGSPPPQWFVRHAMAANQPGFQYQRPPYQFEVPRGQMQAPMSSVPFYNRQMPHQQMVPFGPEQHFARFPMGCHEHFPPPYYPYQPEFPAQPFGRSEGMPATFSQQQYPAERHQQFRATAPRLNIERDVKMSKSDLEMACTIEVHGSDVEKSGKDKYFYFFENPRKGGGEIEMFLISDDNVIIIMFKNMEVAEHLIEKGTATVGNVDVRIKKHEPLPVYTNKVLLQYPGAHQDQDSFELLMYIKARSKCEVQDRESGTRQDALIVSFTEFVDVSRLQDVCRQKPFKEKEVKVSEVGVPSSLLVNGVPINISRETLHDYFETHKTDVLEVIPSSKRGSYLIHLSNFRDAIKLVEMQHTLQHCTLELFLYHKQIGSDRMEKQIEPEIKEPCFLDVSPLIGRFIKKTLTVRSEIEKKITDQGMNFTITESNKLCVTTSSNLTDKKELVNSACIIVHAIVDHQSIKVPHGLDAQSILDGISHDPREVKFYTDKITISIVGRLSKTSEMRKKVEERIKSRGGNIGLTTEVQNEEEKARRQPENISAQHAQPASHKKTMTFSNQSLVAQYLYDHSFQDEVQKKHSGVRLCIDVDKGEVIVEGPDRDTVQSGQIMIHEMVNSLETTELQSVSEQQAAFLNNIGVREILLAQQKQQGIKASWRSKTSSVEIIARSRQEAKDSESFLSMSVLERIIPLPQNMFTLFGSSSWQNEVQKLQEFFLDQFSITPRQDKSYLMILGLNDNIEALFEEISSYLDQNDVQENVVPLLNGEARFISTHLKSELDKIAKDLQQNHGQLSMKGDSILISGPKPSLEKATDELKTLSRKIHNRKESINKAGMARLMRSEKGNIIRSHVENKHRCVIETEDEMAVKGSDGATAAERTPASPPVILAVSNLSHGRKVYVRQGDITSFTVDALVNAANGRLDHCGGLAKEIVDKGGNSIQEECQRYVKQHGNLDEGEAMVSGSGSLPCDVLIHAVGPNWSGGTNKEEDYLHEVVLKSLEFAEEKGCVSIAIPGLSTGIFGYPVNEATRVITKAVDKYFKEKQNSSIKDIFFCDRQDSTLNAFVNAMERVFGRVSKIQTRRVDAPRGATSDRGSVGRGESRSYKDVALVTGEIAKINADVIVNSSSEDLDLSKGAVSKSLLNVAGPDMQNEVSRKRRASPKEVIVTNGYNLPCKKVYHSRPSPYKTDQEAEREVRGWVQQCLEMGHKHPVKSMVFPALGTGILNYPPEVVAECMLDTIQQFWVKNPTTKLTDVRIVLYHKDDQTKKAFEDIKNQLRQRASQKLRPDLKRGDITRFKGDVIVNATDESLNMNRGSLSKSISDAAGSSLIKDCKQKYPNGCPGSGVAVTTAGLLNAKNIYHAYVPQWNKKHGQRNLMNAVKFCLEEAHSNNHQSILFPTLGVGLQGYKRDVAARCMYKAFDSFWASHPGTSLTGVQIVIFEDDTAKEFEKEMSTFFSTKPVSRKNRRFKAESGEEVAVEDTNINVLEGVTIGNNIQFSIVHGDLLKENVDCVVCSVKAGFDLERGIINRVLLQRFPSAFTNRDMTKAKEINKKGYTVTEMPSGPFRCLLHFEQFFNDHDIVKILKKCIKVADGLNCISVALPALGQGPEGGVPERIFMEYLYDSLTKLKDLKNIREVRLVILEQDMYERFMILFSELVKMQGLKAKRFWKGHCLKEDVLPKGAYHPKKRRPSVLKAAQTSVDVCFFSDIEANIELAKQELLTSSDKEFDDQKVENHAITLFGEQRMKQLQEEARRRGVVLTIDVRLGRCRVKGIQKDINDMIRLILEMCIDQKDDDAIASTVQWFFIDETAVEELVEYDPDTNKKLEKTYREGKETYRLEDMDGKCYIVDFVKMVEFFEDDPTSECAVLRKDLLNAKEVDFPASWQLGVVENLKIIRIDPACPEFQRVASKFGRTKKQIIKIERIQNKSLYKQYQAKKHMFEQRTTNTRLVERELWHGTAIDAIPSINKEGFNRSFCGKNAVAFGNGVYFAVDPSYSTNDRYARKDSLGNQYIYLVDVLTGEYTNGKPGLRVPPARDPQDASVLFDSVVNNMQDINMFIIFNDTQAYPKYLITFK